MSSFETLSGLVEKAKSQPDVAKELIELGEVQFETGTDHFYIGSSGGMITVNRGKASNPRVTVTSEESVLEEILTGKRNPISAFMTGKLKIGGDLAEAQRLMSTMDRVR